MARSIFHVSVLILGLIATPGPFAPRPAAAAGRLYVIIAVDSEDESIGPWVSTDSMFVNTFLMGSVDEQRLPSGSIKTISGERIGSRAILSAIRALPSDSDDTILFFYSGHGAYDEIDGHYFTFSGPDGHLARSSVRKAIEAKRPRLGVLISDCCFSYVKAQYAVSAPMVLRPDTTSPLLSSLLFDVRGFVDLTSSKQGQNSFVHNEAAEGSIFTVALVKYFEANRQRRLSWNQAFGGVRDRAASVFKNLYPNGAGDQFAQTAWAFTLDATPIQQPPMVDPLPGNQSRFGVTAVANGTDGVRVSQVEPGYPGTRCRVPATGQTMMLEPGDVILTINDQHVHSLDDFWNLVRKSPKEMTFTGRDSRNGRVLRLRTTLRDVNGGGGGRTGSRFGVVVVENGGRGVRVTDVWQGYPGKQVKVVATGELLRLEAGDVILTVNGTRVGSVQEYWNAVKASPRRMNFSIRNVRGGQIVPMVATLRY